jgi:epoxyqueuosine reductase
MEPLEPRLKAEARRLGFSLCGIAPATDAETFPLYEEWLDAGYAGEMAYLETRREARRHPRHVAANVRSVVMLGFEYGDGQPTAVPLPPLHGRVAKYAQGPDYHRLLWDRANALAAWLERESPGCHSRCVTDTAPLLERDFARRAGLGWIGKNTMLINPGRGSFFFLAALLTDLELQSDEPFVGNHCGTCTACLEACPTKAFPQPGVLDATKCISYLTIEHRSATALELREGIDDWLFGCDVCQDVCPWNRFAGAEPIPFSRDRSLATLDCIELLGLSDEEFRKRFRGTSFLRAKRSGLLRNAAIVLGNVGDETVLPVLERSMEDSDEVVREAARWAISRIRQRVFAFQEALTHR